MKNLSLFILLVIGLSFSQCKKEDPHVWNDPDIPGGNVGTNYSIDKGTSISIDAFGLVRDESGNPLSGVKVTMSGKTYTSNNLGQIKISQGTAYDRFAYIQAEKPGYFKGSRVFVPQPGVNRFEITLMAKGTPELFQSGNGAVVKTGNAEVVFGKAYKDGAGNAYTGEVTAYTKYLDPEDPNINKIMPGDLRGANEQGEKILVTYGMVVVELEGASGQKLQPADGKPATLKMKVPASLTSAAPAKIPLWHFDEVKGIWGHEGEATLVDGVYVGTVSHFSFWNCDTPLDYTRLIAKVTSNNKVIPELSVQIKRPSGERRKGYIDEKGNFGGLIPAGENLEIEFFVYGSLVYSEAFNSGNAESITKSYSIPTINFATVSGTVKGCNGSLVPSGQMMVDNWNIAPIIDGMFSFRAYKVPGKVVELTAIYLHGGNSQTRIIPIDKENIVTPDFGLCPNGGATDDFEFSFSLDGQNYQIEGVKSHTTTDSMDLFYGGKAALDFSTDHDFRFSFVLGGDWDTKSQFKIPGAGKNGYFYIHLGNGIMSMYPDDVDINVISKSPYNIQFSGTCTYYDQATQQYKAGIITNGKIIEK
ncbi:MAG TPA: hypothetical protein DIW47_02485 [Bacteroidetes bacterium]|nr:hypothetical protein [Bacteroidota bacterium]